MNVRFGSIVWKKSHGNIFRLFLNITARQPTDDRGVTVVLDSRVIDLSLSVGKQAEFFNTIGQKRSSGTSRRAKIIRMKRLASYFIAFVVLAPTTLVTAPLTFAGLVVAWASIVEHGTASPLAIFSVLTFGWFGLASMWLLFFHYLKSASNPPASKLHCCALLAGSAVSLTLVASTAGGLLFRVLFFGWPLIGAVFFLSLLFVNRKAGHRHLNSTPANRRPS